eukprot:3835681-Heterocapsa_arctica.AAC.1
MHRADWMMPAIDPDEFIRHSPDTFRAFPEAFDALTASHANVTDISFVGFRFLKPDDPKDISVTSTLRQLEPQQPFR